MGKLVGVCAHCRENPATGTCIDCNLLICKQCQDEINITGMCRNSRKTF